MTSFRYRYATRLNSFLDSGGPLSALRRIAAIPGIAAVEFNYPEHVAGGDASAFVEEARGLGLEVSAVNLRFDPREFRLGAFTNPDPRLRNHALAIAREAVDAAAAAEIPHVILWMGPDGFRLSLSSRLRETLAVGDRWISRHREPAALRCASVWSTSQAIRGNAP